MRLRENDAFEAAVASVAGSRQGRIVLGLSRMRAVLRRLGHPERRLPPSIHIAGTNGKGSTAAFADSVLRAHNVRTAVFTSPHLVCFNERLCLPDGNVQLQAFKSALAAVRRTKTPLTPFEAVTAASLLLIAEADAQAAVIETGLGGRYSKRIWPGFWIATSPWSTPPCGPIWMKPARRLCMPLR